MVKVSIGMPVYNVAEYLPQCLDSIINQTFTDFEVIMVDIQLRYIQAYLY